MSLLSGAELSECRDLAEQAMPGSCTIQARTETNTKGSVEVTYANAYTGVKCRVMPVNRSRGEFVSGNKVSDQAEYILTLPFDQALSAHDRIVYESKVYEIVDVHAEHNYRTAVRAGIKLIDGGV